MLVWHLITGEYPPQCGGVSDHTLLVAQGLASAGDEVHVWAPRWPGTLDTPGVTIHRLPDYFGPRGLWQLGTELRREQRPFRLLVQYVPHMYGYRNMNLLLCLWLRTCCPVRPWVLFHEVAYPIGRGHPVKHNLLGIVQRAMAALVAGAAERVFVTTPAWEPLLRRLAPQVPQCEWLPVPSNIPQQARPDAVAALRARAGPGAGKRGAGSLRHLCG